MSTGPHLPSLESTSTTGNSMHISLIGAADKKKKHAQITSQNTVSAAEVEKMLRLIEAVSSAPDRTKAVEAVVAQITANMSCKRLRCGIGKESLQRVYDRSLGWLGRESTIFSDAEKHWESLKTNAGGSKAAEATLVASIPQHGGDGRCVVWIDGPDVTTTPHHWLIVALPTVAQVFWDRPTRSWLRTPERIGVGAFSWSWIALAVCACIALWPVNYRVPCAARVEPLQQRIVATPFESTLLQSNVRPGDSVKAGDTIVRLDGRPLRLEMESIATDIQQAAKEHNVALHTGKIAEAQQAKLKKRGLERRQELLADRLDRLDVVSPIDGVVVSGDLQRFIGSPLEIGQTIVEVAPLDRMAIELEIPELDIGFVRAKADTRVRISGVGGESIRSNISILYPAAEIRDGKNVFVARIEVDNEDGKLRPGMQGEATTYGPVRPQIWSWLRSSWEKLLWRIGY